MKQVLIKGVMMKTRIKSFVHKVHPLALSQILALVPLTLLGQTGGIDPVRLLAAGGTINLPAGTYLLSRTVQLPPRTNLTCADGAVISDAGKIGTLLFVKGPGISISNCTLLVHSSSVVVSFMPNTSELTLRTNTFKSTDNAVGMIINVGGTHDISIIGNKFDNLSFGILQNTQGGDLANADIEDNSFTDLTADGIELNNPSADCASCPKRLTVAKASKILIKNNTFDIPLPAKITTRAAGFCVGVAGAHDVTIQHNQCKTFYQGIHLEDQASNVSIIDNTISTNDPSDFGFQAGIFAIDGREIDIERNTIKDSMGNGIQIDYDPKHQVTGLKILDNDIANCRGVGISIAAGTIGPANAEVARNRVQGCKTSVHLAGQKLAEVNLHDNKLSAGSGCPIEYGEKVDRAQIRLNHNTLANATPKPDCHY